ncbi:MAG: hypothetical protein PHS30_09035 [Bacteroidales bacterium]|nr:hypothetical protein [Bacteroidales bacterium]
MPYRRLPNTDQARIRAMQTAIEICSRTNVPDLAFSIKTKNETETFLPIFEGAQHDYLTCLNNQVTAGKKYQLQIKTVRLYISHFIQVLNFGVIRNEIKSELKRLYGLDPKNFSVPDLSTEKALLLWGERIINGEQERIKNGGAPIYNPAIAKVRVHYDIFKDAGISQKTYQKSTNRTLEILTSLRKAADEIILDIWNQVEDYYKSYPEEIRRAHCQAYGLHYYFRKNEKNISTAENAEND